MMSIHGAPPYLHSCEGISRDLVLFSQWRGLLHACGKLDFC
jgi:hypothetical protein